MNCPMTKGRKGGFTLIEILVVLVIASIISSITFGAFRSISEGNRRTSCQANLSQIYQASRQYAQDYDNKFPYLNEKASLSNAATPQGGLGLWALYMFPKAPPAAPNFAVSRNCNTTSTVPGSINVDLPAQSELIRSANPLTGYLKSPKVFHCPADNNDQEVQYRDDTDTCAAIKLSTGQLTFVGKGGTYTNPAYLSYQTRDDVGTLTTDTYADTYAPFRAPENTAVPVRQLVPYADTPSLQFPDRPTRELTIITWCRWHRRLDSNSLATKPGRRNYDNVLFSDGSVQNLPAEQNVTQSDGVSTGTCRGWQRVPRGKADSMKDADDCIPSP